jgi:exosortase/archaeosortase family protein
MNNKEAVNLAVRYFALIVIGLFHKQIFNFIFTPLTFWPSVWILSAFYDHVVTLHGNIISYANVYARIISACIAGAAYYLLLILNLTTPMDALKRAWSIVFLVVSFLVLNILRIVVFAAIATAGGNYFEAAHMVMWYFGSTVMVVLIWFLAVWLFKIKDIPVYTDMQQLYYDSVSRRGGHRKR